MVDIIFAGAVAVVGLGYIIYNEKKCKEDEWYMKKIYERLGTSLTNQEDLKLICYDNYKDLEKTYKDKENKIIKDTIDQTYDLAKKQAKTKAEKENEAYREFFHYYDGLRTNFVGDRIANFAAEPNKKHNPKTGDAFFGEDGKVYIYDGYAKTWREI